MDNFNTLTASVSGASVILSWTLTGDASVATNVGIAVLRAPFNSDDWTTLALDAISTVTYTDTPDAGQWQYRIAVGAPLNGPTGTLTALYSNTVDVTTEATTGVVVLSGSVATPSNQDISGPTGFQLISLSWVFDDADTDDDVLKYVVQRSLDAGVTWRDDVTTSQLAHGEELPTGTGSVQYRVKASLPNVGTGNQLNAPVVTTSNVVTLSV